MFSVAITGEIGAGKSTLAKIWGGMGANVFDLDSLAKKQWSRPEIKEAASRRWGEDAFPDGVPDYKKLAEYVYKNVDEYRFTIGLIHPPAITEATRMFHNLGGWIVFEIPLLYETGWFDLIDCVICVTSTDDLRMARSSSRGWKEHELTVREQFLVGSPQKQAMSDIVLCNIGSLEAWEARARELGALMLKMATVHEISVFCQSHDEARKITSALLDNRLVAGANIANVESAFRWKREISDVQEWRIRGLTTERNLRQAMQCIKQNHVYELPVITAREVVRSDYHTLKWVVDNCE
jgi:dephospho-CoA kinase